MPELITFLQTVDKIVDPSLVTTTMGFWGAAVALLYVAHHIITGFKESLEKAKDRYRIPKCDINRFVNEAQKRQKNGLKFMAVSFICLCVDFLLLSFIFDGPLELRYGKSVVFEIIDVLVSGGMYLGGVFLLIKSVWSLLRLAMSGVEET